jgi:hypothetical protein
VVNTKTLSAGKPGRRDDNSDKLNLDLKTGRSARKKNNVKIISSKDSSAKKSPVKRQKV